MKVEDVTTKVVSVIIGVILVCLAGVLDGHEHKPGDVYVRVRYSENPFKENDTIRRYIIDVKKGYIKYVDLKRNDTCSAEAFWFDR
jgi:hypothetical protein